jgi:hypothetical protein
MRNDSAEMIDRSGHFVWRTSSRSTTCKDQDPKVILWTIGHSKVTRTEIKYFSWDWTISHDLRTAKEFPKEFSETTRYSAAKNDMT